MPSLCSVKYIPLSLACRTGLFDFYCCCTCDRPVTLHNNHQAVELSSLPRLCKSVLRACFDSYAEMKQYSVHMPGVECAHIVVCRTIGLKVRCVNSRLVDAVRGVTGDAVPKPLCAVIQDIDNSHRTTHTVACSFSIEGFTWTNSSSFMQENQGEQTSYSQR